MLFFLHGTSAVLYYIIFIYTCIKPPNKFVIWKRRVIIYNNYSSGHTQRLDGAWAKLKVVMRTCNNLCKLAVEHDATNI